MVQKVITNYALSNHGPNLHFGLNFVDIFSSKIEIKIFAGDTISFNAESFYTNKLRTFSKF